MKLKTRLAAAVCALGMFLAQGGTIGAQEETAVEPVADSTALWTTEVAVDTLWVLAVGFLVFFMNAGFGCVEAGFCRAKNAVNILGKNFVVFGISSLAFWILGWAIMFGDGNDWLGSTGWLVAIGGDDPRSCRFRLRPTLDSVH